MMSNFVAVTEHLSVFAGVDVSADVCVHVCTCVFAFTCRCRSWRRCCCLCMCVKFFCALSAWRVSLSAFGLAPARLHLACSFDAAAAASADVAVAVAAVAAAATVVAVAMLVRSFRLIFTKSRST